MSFCFDSSAPIGGLGSKSFGLLASASVSVAATLIPGFASSFVCKKSGVNSLRYTTTKLHGERKLHLVKNPLCVKPTKG